MQKCLKCSSAFSKKEIYETLWKLNGYYVPIICHSCGGKHFVTFPTRMFVSASFVVPIMINLNYFHNDNIAWTGVSAIAIIVLSGYLFPYYAKYRLKK